MRSSSSPSPDDRNGLLQRFLFASRRGAIVALINSARLEGDLGPVVAAELCEAYDAEIGFVLIARPGSDTPELIGGVGLTGDDPVTLLEQPVCREALSGDAATAQRGTDLLGLGIRNLVLAPRTAGAARLLVGVGRLYDQPFEPLELALLETVTKSAAHALERFGLERQLQRAHETGAAEHSDGPIAHEFYRTLATIIGHCDLATGSLHREASEIDPELREIKATAESGAALVQQLLALSRRQVSQSVGLDADDAAAEISPPLPPQLRSLADLFRLLAHPARMRILLALGSDTLSPSELEERLDIGLGLLAYHVGVLRDGGLLMLVDTRPARGALESFYRLTGRGEFARDVLVATWREMSDIAQQAAPPPA